MKLPEGIYKLVYRAARQSLVQSDEAMASLRNGRILGSDRQGGLFSGECTYDPKTGRTQMRIDILVPPHARLVTGFQAGAEGATLAVAFILQGELPVSHAVFVVFGESVELELTYLTPLPT